MENCVIKIQLLLLALLAERHRLVQDGRGMRGAGCGIKDGGAHGMAPAVLTCRPVMAWRDRSENTHGILNEMGQMEEVIIGLKSNYITFGLYSGV